MRNFTIADILIPGATLRTTLVDFDKEPELKRLYEETKKRQAKILKQRDQPFKNLEITI